MHASMTYLHSFCIPLVGAPAPLAGALDAISGVEKYNGCINKCMRILTSTIVRLVYLLEVAVPAKNMFYSTLLVLLLS